MKKAYIVLGTGYGDEGKGTAVDYHCSQASSHNPIVIRFSGGHQASHTVNLNGQQHIFSSYGSGGLRGVPTFWSKYCTFQPQAAYNEFLDLLTLAKERGDDVPPLLYVDAECPVTTPYDMWYNRFLEDRRGDQRHGSVGVGIGATFARHEETHYRLYARDLKYPVVLEEKLERIKKYYLDKFPGNNEVVRSILSLDLEGYKQAAKETFYEIAPAKLIFEAYQTFIFEGSQGILLDQDYGFFPHVTRSYTTSRNAREMLKEFLPHIVPEITYVTRCYATRHGAGPLHGEMKMDLVNLETETNQFGAYQKAFRYAPLNLDLLDYAISCDRYNSVPSYSSILLVTCVDQLPNANLVLKKIENRFWGKFRELLVNDSPESKTIKPLLLQPA